MLDKFEVLGCPCTAVNHSQAAIHLEALLGSQQLGYTVAINAEKILKYADYSDFSEIIDNSIFPYPDGSGAVLGLRWLHGKLSEKINMPVLALEVANKLGIATFIIGANEYNHSRAVNNIRDKYQQINIVGNLNGYIDYETLVSAIKRTKPRLILVAMGSPKQEKFAAQILAEIDFGIVVGCGGALDIIAGELKRAPDFMINNHLEWLFRLYKEPWRIKRQLFLPRFMWRLSRLSVRRWLRSWSVSNRDNVAVVGTVGVPASYGGLETLVDQIIVQEELSWTVYCSSTHYDVFPRTYKKANLIYIPLSANGPVSVVYDIFSILHAIFSGHRQFLILGTSGAIIIPVIKFLIPSSHMVTNIDGIEWRREKWQGFLAKRFLKFSERLAVKYSSVVIADNEIIAEYVDKEYQRECKIIAYGGDHAFVTPPSLSSEQATIVDKPFYLALCRIEPENNVSLILQAFSKIQERLIFIGNWHSSDYGRTLRNEFCNVKSIVLLDPVYDENILAIYRSRCIAYIHGHSAGGTNPSLVEMMYFEKPIVAFDCLYNRATMENHGSFFNSADALKALIETAEGLPVDEALQDVAQRRYKWHDIRKQYLELFGH